MWVVGVNLVGIIIIRLIFFVPKNILPTKFLHTSQIRRHQSIDNIQSTLFTRQLPTTIMSTNPAAAYHLIKGNLPAYCAKLLNVPPC
jgi:hypothetical protein